MAERKWIPGRPGTAPLGAPPRNDRPPGDPPSRRRPARPAPPPAPVTPPPHERRVAKATPSLAAVIEAAKKDRDALLAKPHVLDVRGGYKFIRGRITEIPAIVVIVDRKVFDLPPNDRIPEIAPSGFPTDVAPADPYERLAAAKETVPVGYAVPRAPQLLIDDLQSGAEEFGEEAIRQITYEPPADGDLSPVTGAMKVICHVSPDAGWAVLKPFLEKAKSEICLGMYDFTAPHIYRTARTLLKDEAIEWRQTLGPGESLPAEDDVDSTKADDKAERQVITGLKRVGGSRFRNAFAHVGAGLTFASAYHIKVAVRDRKSFWLSSGNWQSSNQPDIDFLAGHADLSLIPRYNREWHVVVENAELARTFRVYLEHDFATASAPIQEATAAPLPNLLIPVDEFLAEEAAARFVQAFPPREFAFTQDEPLTVQPILTPDNYMDIVSALLRRRPKKTLYFQNQSLNPVKRPTPEFQEVMKLLAEYSNDSKLDVRLIFRNIGPVRKKLESLQAAGFNMERVRMQSGCHTKGIIIDSKTVLIGSHNFTNEGLQVNRDASLLIRNADIARYYERIFLHDWDVLSRETIREEATPIPAVGGAEAAIAESADYVRVPWSYLDED